MKKKYNKKSQKSWRYVQDSINQSLSQPNLHENALSSRRIASQISETNAFHQFDQRIQKGFIQYLQTKNVQHRVTLNNQHKSSSKSLKNSRSLQQLLSSSPLRDEKVNTKVKKQKRDHAPLNRNIFDIKTNSSMARKRLNHSLSNKMNARNILNTSMIDIGSNHNRSMNTKKANRAYLFLKYHLHQPYPYPTHHALIKRKISIRNDKIYQKRLQMKSLNNCYVIGVCHKALMAQRPKY